MTFRIFALTVILLSFAMLAHAQIATGGPYGLTQAVVGNGGGTSQDGGGLYKVEGTAGQAVAGTNSTGGNYGARSGFWAANAFVPTAAGASVTGKIVGPDGIGIRGVSVTLSGGNLITPRATRSTSFGAFTFDDIEVGQTYIISVQSRRYGFSQSTQVIAVMDNVGDLVFQANWINQ